MPDDREVKGDRALTFREAKALYGVPEHRLRQYRAERRLDFFKLGRAVFVSERSLVQFLEQHRQRGRTANDRGGGVTQNTKPPNESS